MREHSKMAAKKKRPSKEILEQWIEDVNSEGRNLSEWETNFMESITEQFATRGGMSEKQEEILERIYCEKVK
jgi:hypothetical protein